MRLTHRPRRCASTRFCSGSLRGGRPRLRHRLRRKRRVPRYVRSKPHPSKHDQSSHQPTLCRRRRRTARLRYRPPHRRSRSRSLLRPWRLPPSASCRRNSPPLRFCGHHLRRPQRLGQPCHRRRFVKKAPRRQRVLVAPPPPLLRRRCLPGARCRVNNPRRLSSGHAQRYPLRRRRPKRCRLRPPFGLRRFRPPRNRLPSRWRVRFRRLRRAPILFPPQWLFRSCRLHRVFPYARNRRPCPRQPRFPLPPWSMSSAHLSPPWRPCVSIRRYWVRLPSLLPARQCALGRRMRRLHRRGLRRRLPCPRRLPQLLPQVLPRLPSPLPVLRLPLLRAPSPPRRAGWPLPGLTLQCLPSRRSPGTTGPGIR